VYAIGAGGSGAATWASTNPYVTVSATTNSALKVSGDADIQGNLTVNGSNISEILAKIQDRLAILVPDPVRLDKYEALKQAYEHYKVLEALCVEETNPGAKK
jgi:CO dehydrogenase nickel-insertion accessory protein CooC1